MADAVDYGDMTSPYKRFSVGAAILFAAVAPALAQTAEGKNLFPNGSFERASTSTVLWDGVDRDNYLAVERDGLAAVTESGQIADMAMPVSVAVGDMNGNGLPDIVAASPRGHIRIYFNGGTKTEPKFSHGELVPVLMTEWHDKHRKGGGAPRIALGDFGRRGVLDILAGNYLGDLVFLKNDGSPGAPNFRQPTTTGSRVLTTKEGTYWGNLFAPAVHDWNRDGRLDVLLGEGSYSANSIHLLLNEGGAPPGKFSEASRYYLIYGEGREQLIPAVVDYNGDGLMDVLVSDRKGTVSVHLGKAGWRPGDTLDAASNITFGSSTSLGGSIAIAAGDFNGDGLFDLVIGKANGRIALALNSGTKEEPKFSMPVDLKGEDVYPTVSLPTGWTIFDGAFLGNFWSYVTAVNADTDSAAEPPDGKNVLKFGYFPPHNKTIGLKGYTRQGRTKITPLTWHLTERGNFHSVIGNGWQYAPNFFSCHYSFGAKSLKVGSNYTLSFKIKGKGMKDGEWQLGWGAQVETAPAKIVRGERGSAQVTRNAVADVIIEKGTLPSSAAWTTVTKNINVKFNKKEMAKLTHAQAAIFQIGFTLQPFDGVVYVDDVKLVERP